MKKRASHEERIALILDRLTVMLEGAELPPAAPCGDDRNIFRSATEIALATEAGILLLQVADTFVEGERNLLDAELDRFIALHRAELRRPVPCRFEGYRDDCERCWASHDDATPYCSSDAYRAVHLATVKP